MSIILVMHFPSSVPEDIELHLWPNNDKSQIVIKWPDGAVKHATGEHDLKQAIKWIEAMSVDKPSKARSPK